MITFLLLSIAGIQAISYRVRFAYSILLIVSCVVCHLFAFRRLLTSISFSRELVFLSRQIGNISRPSAIVRSGLSSSK